ncbi:alpha/beta fold hydrolase, partial [Oryzihumus sp.]
LEDRDLRDVVLVGHSYAGLVAGIVADRAPDRVAHTVFLDANVPIDGASMVDGWSAAGQGVALAVEVALAWGVALAVIGCGTSGGTTTCGPAEGLATTRVPGSK